jgi:hypothetical protein
VRLPADKFNLRKFSSAIKQQHYDAGRQSFIRDKYFPSRFAFPPEQRCSSQDARFSREINDSRSRRVNQLITNAPVRFCVKMQQALFLATPGESAKI